MKLTLVIDGKQKDFYSRDITVGACFTAYDLLEEIEEGSQDITKTMFNRKNREKLLQFVVEFFGGQFTEQEFLTCPGTPFKLIPEFLRAVVAGVNDKVIALPNAPAGDEAKA